MWSADLSNHRDFCIVPSQPSGHSTDHFDERRRESMRVPRSRAVLALAAMAALAFAAPAHAANPTFAPYASYQTGSGAGPGPAPVNTVAADFNGDGHPDVATVNN